MTNLHSEYMIVGRILAPFILRRVKLQVADQLVPKQHKLLLVEPTAAQQQQYQKVLQDYKDRKCSNTAQYRTHIFSQLRKVANHPLLARHHFTDEIIEKCIPKWMRVCTSTCCIHPPALCLVYLLSDPTVAVPCILVACEARQRACCVQMGMFGGGATEKLIRKEVSLCRALIDLAHLSYINNSQDL